MKTNKIYLGDCLDVLKTFPDNYIDCVVTSPPYWALRDYGVDGQLGLEPTFQEYITKLCDIFDEVKRVLKKDGTCWVNMGDTYFGSGKGAGSDISNSKQVWTFTRKEKNCVHTVERNLRDTNINNSVDQRVVRLTTLKEQLMGKCRTSPLSRYRLALQ